MKHSLKGEITSILYSAPIVDNLARKTFVALFITALIQTRKVQFNELATVLNDEAKIASNQNRIEDFFRDVTLNFNVVAQLMMSLLPQKTKLRLTIDRTEWERSGVPVRQMSSQYADGAGRLWGSTTAPLLGAAG
ncbi:MULTISPECIES: hypothetical protein [unclassified Spirosoma]|mgnify:CR=1 FL=1|uniref:hypothetical protein n=1 Tax=unclassified Spirosoma TaxID=2621999 RepID=UPI00095965FA|nr:MULTISPECIES: hypothetical protein [unclassified Spirosoma]MBN8826384.1 hypothetical protein [Spirosoma sp.]OJW75775.1 MAG: hypothetical protein BGO59_04625 [Spirosoma sp. 48-14]